MNVFSVSLLLALTTASFSVHAQRSNERRGAEKEYAQRVLAATHGLRRVPLPDTLLPTKAVAIATVEPMLFSGYSKDIITQEQPYEAYLMDGFWHISGTLPKGSKGGVFEIIIDAHNCRVVRLIHGN